MLSRAFYLEMKNLGLYGLVPPAIVVGLTPLTVLAATAEGQDPSIVATVCQLLIPVFAPWWPLLILREYVDSPARELLLVYAGRRSALFARMIICWVLFVALCAVSFLYLSTRFGRLWLLFIAVAVQSAALIAAAYCLALVVRNTFLPLLFNVTYCVGFMLTAPNLPVSIFQLGLYDRWSDLGKVPAVGVLAVGLFAVGHWLETRGYVHTRL
ncbi:hypothetical protein ThesuDRAFT_01045 [Thermaerobacter subterraneus DSM 13965]|uniref:ABC-2 family transporter protein n=1 Tax=Thermaerobacter subterraneus DSM 13965 TaxID=867903 RepID=K6Q2P0_9FIRM|nr:hypothetical protein ThesuDRAFT_01045 [Thermaerobacter subterraneus DSM 13965]